MLCFCNSKKIFEECCKPIIDGIQPATTANQLMRSRFTAYCLKNFTYIFNTYAASARAELSIEELEESARNTQWFALYIPTCKDGQLEENKVEFFAYYFLNRKPYLLHETSEFQKENESWRYLTGILHQDCGKITIGRNDMCVCKSGKKFKQCCMKKAK